MVHGKFEWMEWKIVGLSFVGSYDLSVMMRQGNEDIVNCPDE